MKKTILALSIISSLTSTSGFAAKALNKSAEDTEVMVVTANRTQQQKFDVLAAVDVFDRDAIEHIQPLSIADLLNRVAGITTTSQGTAAHQTALHVRGSNSNHVLVLVNGVRVGSATLGIKNLASIPVELVERVEVVRGPRAALWGADAMGGVIQIFTREFDANDGQLGLKLGSDNLWQAYGVIGFGNTNHKYTLSTTLQKSDGFDVIKPDPSNPYPVDQPDKDGFKRESIALTGMSQLNDTYSIELNAQYDQGNTEFDANTLYGGDEVDFENHHVLVRGHAQLENIYLQLGLATSTDSNEDNFDQYQTFSSAALFDTSRDQISFLAQIPLLDDSELVLGSEWYSEEITSTTQYSDTKRSATAIFATGRHSIDQFKLEASARRDKVGDINAEVTYQLSAGYQLSEQLLIAISNGTAFKAPTFNDLFWPENWGSAGNPNLVSETADNTELLGRYQTESYGIELALYKTDYDNLIEWAQIDASDPYSGWQPSNVAKAKIKGAEATINAEIMGTSNTLTLSHIDAENTSSGQQLFRRPHFSANYNLNYAIDSWDISVDINHQGSRLDTNSKRLNSYTLISFGASYSVSENLKLLAKITNLGNKNYFQVTEYPGEERGYSMTIDYRF